LKQTLQQAGILEGGGHAGIVFVGSKIAMALPNPVRLYSKNES